MTVTVCDTVGLDRMLSSSIPTEWEPPVTFLVGESRVLLPPVEVRYSSLPPGIRPSS